MLSFNDPLINETASKCPVVMIKRVGISSAWFDVEFVMILYKYCDQWEDPQMNVNEENSSTDLHLSAVAVEVIFDFKTNQRLQPLALQYRFSSDGMVDSLQTGEGPLYWDACGHFVLVFAVTIGVWLASTVSLQYPCISSSSTCQLTRIISLSERNY